MLCLAVTRNALGGELMSLRAHDSDEGMAPSRVSEKATKSRRVLKVSGVIAVICVLAVAYKFLPNLRDSRSASNQQTDTLDQKDLPEETRPKIKIVPGDVIVQYKPNVSRNDKAAVLESFHAVVKEDLRAKPLGAASMEVSMAASIKDQNEGSLELVSISETFKANSTSEENRVATEKAISSIASDPRVDFAEPNYIYSATAQQFVSNDPYYVDGRLWGMHGKTKPAAEAHHQPVHRKRASTFTQRQPRISPVTKTKPPKVHHPVGKAQAANLTEQHSQTGAPTGRYGTHADEAWESGHVGARTVYIGIIDSGIQYDHPDLASNVWKRVGDDFYDTKEKSMFASNENPHGTHVAGIVAAIGGNHLGVAGVVWNATLISAKFLGPDGTGETADAVKAFDYLTNLKITHKLNIVAINTSWAGYGYSKALSRSIKLAAQQGILCVAAAANDGLNNDKYKAYPASYDTRDNTDGKPGLNFNAVISVAAIGPDGNLAPFSNFGLGTVALAAPGVGIWSTYPHSTYSSLDGTSMAAPHVTGAVALYASVHPTATASEIRDAIEKSVTHLDSLSGRTTTGGTLNVSRF